MYKIYYHNDMDGITSRYLVDRYLKMTKGAKDNDIISFMLNHTPSDETKLSKATDGDEVYIVDYSFTKNNINILFALMERCNNKVVWIDHHTTSIEALELNTAKLKPICYYISNAGSGVYLTWSYFFRGEEPPFWVKLVSDYDTWKYEYEESTFFKLAFDAASNKDEFIDQLFRNPLHYQNCVSTGEVIKEYVDQDNVQYLEEFGYESKLPDGTPIYVVNKSSNSWIFGDKYYDYDAVVVFAFNGEDFAYSMFSSKPYFDCSKYALKYGGGGHKGSAGWRSKEILFKKTSK